MDKNPHLPGSAEEFITANMGLAQNIAWKYYSAAKRDERIKFDQDDFLSIAYIGLIKAYRGFNPTKFKGVDGGEVKFSTYAVPTIRGEIWRQTRDNGYTIRKHRFLEAANVDSLDRVINPNDADRSILVIDTIKEHDCIDENQVIANVFMSTLGPRLRKIYKLSCAGLNQEKIGKELGLTQVSVSRMIRYIEYAATNWSEGKEYQIRYVS